MDYVVKLEAYEGPFDLLLDLIEQNEVDILDIPIAVITEQYLEYIHTLQEQDLAIGGEFLVMAATLIRIKAKMLLPPEEVEAEEPEEEDPRERLVEQLLRYKAYKEAAARLTERYHGALGYYTRGGRQSQAVRIPIFTNVVGLTVGLGSRFCSVMKDCIWSRPIRQLSSGFPRRSASLESVCASWAGVDHLRRTPPGEDRAEVVVTFSDPGADSSAEIRVRQTSTFYIEILPDYV